MEDKTITDPNDPRFGGGSLAAKLQHQTAQRATAEERAKGLERQLAESAERYQATIRELTARVDALEKERDALMTQLAEPPNPERALVTLVTPDGFGTCVVELCENLAWSNGYCTDHQVVADMVDP